MDYTKYVLKNRDELEGLLAGKDNFLVVACNKCFKEFNTTEEPECDSFAAIAEEQGKHITGTVKVDFLCNKVQTEKKLAGIVPEGTENVVVISCGLGVQTVADLESVPVFTATNSLNYTGHHGMALTKKTCGACAQCYLNVTGGICPIVDCSKSLVNGQCGGAKNGKCEIDPKKDCAWEKIYQRLEKQGRTKEFLDQPIQLRDYSVANVDEIKAYVAEARAKRYEGFYGGVHPTENKEFTEHLALQKFPEPDTVIIPLAMHCKGRPVMMEYTREEEFVNSYVRQGLYTKIKTAVRKSDGKFLAVQNDFYWDGGAYTEYGVNIVKASGFASTGPYEFDNVKTDAYCVYTNNPVGGPYRGFGMCEIHFGIEQNIDEVAKEIGMDPIEIRRVNGLAPGKSTGTGEIMKSCGFLEALDQVAEAIEYDKPCDAPSGPHKVRGKGIAGGWKSPSQPTNAGSAAIIRMNEDGTFFLMTSGHDIGQGSDTALTQIAAEVLCCDPSKFTIRTGDTDHTPYEWQTVASRITYCAGNAIKLAAEDLKEKLLDLAQIKLGYIKRELYLEDGWIINRNHPESRMPMSDLALGLAFEDGSGYGGPAIGVGTFTLPNNINYDPATGYSPKPAAFWTTAAAGAEVEIDTETGVIEVKKMVESCDPGHIVNPELYKAQVEGGMMQALGTVLYEELLLKDGKVLNKSFVDYKIPTIDNAPETFIAMGVEHPEETGPYGARGIGEPAMVPGAPAIANAIYNATGCRFTEMPITPERMLKALQEKAAAEKK